MFRYFGVSWWSIFDVALILGSLVLIAWGGRGFVKCQRRAQSLEAVLGRDQGLADLEVD